MSHWIPVHDGDLRALALYKRHYSYRGLKTGRLNPTFVGPGEKTVLLTLACDALWVWRHALMERKDGQAGIECAVFRNEGPVLSSELVQEACDLAWQRWPGERLFTYVNPRKIGSVNPGYCFKKAGWSQVGTNKDGRLILLAVSAGVGVGYAQVRVTPEPRLSANSSGDSGGRNLSCWEGQPLFYAFRNRPFVRYPG